MFGIFLSILLLASVIFEVSFVHSLPDPFAIIPLTFLLGVLIIHRGQLAIGVMWLLLAKPLFAFFGFDDGLFFAYAFSALLAIPLSKRIFVERSVYAMEGLGALLFISFTAVNMIFASFIDAPLFIGQYITELFFLMIGLYITYLSILPLERLFKQFLLRS